MFIGYLKYLNCIAMYQFGNNLKNQITNTTPTISGTITTFKLENNHVASYLPGSAYISGLPTLTSQSFTISVWFMQTVSAASGVFNTIYDSSNSAGTVYTRLYINSSNSLIFTCKNSSTLTLTYPTTIVNNVWYNVIITKTASACTMYINGISVATGSALTLDISNQTYNYIGAFGSTNGNKFTGCLKNFIICNSVLNEEQIQKLYFMTFIK